MIGTFTKNTLITFITRVLTAIFGILITIVIARTLGAGGQGIYSLAILLPSTLLIFTVFGVNVSSIFYIGKKEYHPKEVLGHNLFFSFFISIFTILLGLVIIFFFSNKIFPGVEKVYLFLALSIIPFNIFFELVSSVLLGMQKIKKYNLFSFSQSFLFLFLIIILILGFRFGIKAAILAQTFSFLFVGIVLFFIAKKETGGLVFKLSKNYCRDAISYGFKNYLGGVLNFLHYRIDMFLINIFLNPIAVGIYYIAVRLAEGIWLISLSAATVLFPKVASETDEKNLKEFTPLVCRNVLFITFLIAILLFISSRWIVLFFYSNEFLDAVLPFQILLIGTLFTSGWRILANDISARGKPMLNNYVIGFSVILNTILNIIYIPKFGIAGAAFTTAISHFTLFLITIFFYAKISHNKIKNIVLPQKTDILFYKNILSLIKKPKK